MPAASAVAKGDGAEQVLPLLAGQGTWHSSTRPQRSRGKIPSAFSIRWCMPLVKDLIIPKCSMTSRLAQTGCMQVMGFLISTPCLDTTWLPDGAVRQAKG